MVLSGEEVTLQAIDGNEEFFGRGSWSFCVGEDAGKLTDSLLETHGREVALDCGVGDFEFCEEGIEAV